MEVKIWQIFGRADLCTFKPCFAYSKAGVKKLNNHFSTTKNVGQFFWVITLPSPFWPDLAQRRPKECSGCWESTRTCVRILSLRLHRLSEFNLNFTMRLNVNWQINSSLDYNMLMIKSLTRTFFALMCERNFIFVLSALTSSAA